MSRTVKPIPDGFHAVTALLAVRGADRALEFYRSAFDATELFRLRTPDGRIVHAQLRIRDCIVMLAEEDAQYNTSPQTARASTVALQLYVEDADAFGARAVAAGARWAAPLQDQFYGDRAGRLVDPFGHHWIIATRRENMDPAEMQRRLFAMLSH